MAYTFDKVLSAALIGALQRWLGPPPQNNANSKTKAKSEKLQAGFYAKAHIHREVAIYTTMSQKPAVPEVTKQSTIALQSYSHRVLHTMNLSVISPGGLKLGWRNVRL